MKHSENYDYFAVPKDNFKNPKIGSFVACIVNTRGTDRRLYVGTVVRDSEGTNGWSIETPDGMRCYPWPGGTVLEIGCSFRKIKSAIMIN